MEHCHYPQEGMKEAIMPSPLQHIQKKNRG